MATSPLIDSYLNVNTNRTVSLDIYDAVGFETGSIQSHVWLEGVHDSNGNGIAEETELELISHEVMNIDTSWQFTIQLDERGNV